MTWRTCLRVWDANWQAVMLIASDCLLLVHGRLTLTLRLQHCAMHAVLRREGLHIGTGLSRERQSTI